jgi:hypothetical protein
MARKTPESTKRPNNDVYRKPAEPKPAKTTKK